jgi:hypothetical protein
MLLNFRPVLSDAFGIENSEERLTSEHIWYVHVQQHKQHNVMSASRLSPTIIEKTTLMVLSSFVSIIHIFT